MIADLILHRLDKIEHLLHKILTKENIIMATLDDVISDINDETTLIESVSTLITGLEDQINALLAGALTPEQQAKVDLIFAGAEANKAKLAAALVANVPPAP